MALQEAEDKEYSYLSYVDSVKFFNGGQANMGDADKALRNELQKLLTRALLAGYMRWAGNAGFRRLYLWACPPKQGAGARRECRVPTRSIVCPFLPSHVCAYRRCETP